MSMSSVDIPGDCDRIVVVPSTGSTNDDVRQALTDSQGLVTEEGAARWPHGSVLRALQQTNGHGRGGRTWVTPAVGALTLSCVIRPLVSASSWGWLPLVAGLAVREALVETTTLEREGWRVGLKWPNDVVIIPATTDARRLEGEMPGWGRMRKIAGILTEMVPTAEQCAAQARGDAGDTVKAWRPRQRSHTPAVIVGIGINVGQGETQLPVPWAASVSSAGAVGDSEQIVAACRRHLLSLLDIWERVEDRQDRVDGVYAAGIAERVREHCLTLGSSVRVRLPDGVCEGTVLDVTPALVLVDAQGEQHIVQAGDVESLRGESHSQ